MTDLQRAAMQAALEALTPLANAHFPDEREVLSDADVSAAHVAIEQLRAALVEPCREWVSLTDQEIWDSVLHGVVGGIGMPSKAVAVARAVEAALRERNT